MSLITLLSNYLIVILLYQGLRVWADISKPPYQGREGGMKIFDFNRPADGAKDLKILYTTGTFDLEKFNPHGMSVWDDTASSGEDCVLI